MRKNFTRRLWESGAFDPFSVPGAHDAFIGDAGVTVVSGRVTQAEDQTGNGNTVSAVVSGQGPTFVSSWRNSRAAFLGRASASSVALRRATHANGPLVQPFTRFVVGDWTSAANTGLTSAGGNLATIFANGASLLPSLFSGTVLTAGTAPAVGRAFVMSAVFAGVSSAARVEPHSAAVITVAGPAGASQLSGLTLLSNNTLVAGNNWRGHLAFLLDVAGNLPVSNLTLYNSIMQWMRDYYSIQAL